MRCVPASVRRLEAAGLFQLGTGCTLSPHAYLEPTDANGITRPIVIGDGCVVADGAKLHGGTTLGEGVVVEEHVIVGKLEHGYAVGQTYTGEGGHSEIGAGVILRSGAIVYAGVHIGPATTIGHGTLLRTGVQVGEASQLGHHLVVERATRIGRLVRCSPLSHLTSSMVIEDRVFVGAGVVTINDKIMCWHQPDQTPQLRAPCFAHGARIGSGATIAAGVRVGRHALVGSASLVTHDVPDHAVVYGVPARVHGRTWSEAGAAADTELTTP